VSQFNKGVYSVIVAADESLLDEGQTPKVSFSLASIGDPEPDPQDPHVFGPPGSGTISQSYGSGSFPFLIRVLSGLK
jgi:hypothetical protein